MTLSSLYEETREKAYLDRSLKLLRESILLNEDQHEELALSLRLLAGSLRMSYDFGETQDLKVLEEALELLSQAAQLSNGDPGSQWSIVRERCGIYHMLFDRTHAPRHIQLAIKYGREGLKLPTGYLDYSKLIDSLSRAYNMRFEFEGEASDLDESIDLLRLAVSNRDDPLAARYLATLANRLRTRCFYQRSKRNIEEAQLHCQASLDIPTPINSDYKYALGTMSLIQHQLSTFDGQEETLQKSIRFAEEAVSLLSSNDENKAFLLGHLSQINNSKYEKSHLESDLLKSIQFAQEALIAMPQTSLRLPSVLNHLSSMLYQHLKHFNAVEHREEIKAHVSRILALPTCRPLVRVRSFTLLASLSLEEKDWTTTFKNLTSAIKLYPKISPRAFTADDQQNTIRELSGLAEIAASCALIIGEEPSRALEILEAGRGIMSGWIINARNDVSRLALRDPKLAARYIFLRDQISIEGMKNKVMRGDTVAEKSTLRLRDQWSSYLYELEEIEERVQTQYAGLESFQRALGVEDMKRLAAKIPIVEINSTGIRSDAFVITELGVTSIPLHNDTYKRLRNLVSTLFGPGRQERSLPHARARTNESLRNDLKWMYENVVSKILGELKIPLDSASNPQRLIWVSSGIASFCPWHAADTFTVNRNECTSAHIISSYIPSLKALGFSRENTFDIKPKGKNEIVVIAMPKTKGQQDISALEEANNISSSFNEVPSNSVNVLIEPSRTAVLKGLKNCSIAHFACHGYANSSNPSLSALLLSDSLIPGKPDELTARDISTSKHEKAQLCYLSACSTAENPTEALIDENIHVASAFQLSGFSHVIGTLWEAGNKAAIEVSRVFYNELAKGMGKEDQELADDAVARALHEAVKRLRETKRAGSRVDPRMDILSWAPFIHLGP